MFGKKNNLKYDIRPLLIALGILLLFILAYSLFLAHKSRVDVTMNEQVKNEEAAKASQTQAELEEKTQKAEDALEEMRAGERKVPTVMDYQRAAFKEQVAIEALRQMHQNNDSSSFLSADQEMTAEERAAKEQAALDALKAMHNQ